MNQRKRLRLQRDKQRRLQSAVWAKVISRSLADPRPNIPHEVVKADMARQRAVLLARIAAMHDGLDGPDQEAVEITPEIESRSRADMAKRGLWHPTKENDQ